MIRLLVMTLFGLLMTFAILIVMAGGMFVLRVAVQLWFDVDFFKKVEDMIRGRN